MEIKRIKKLKVNSYNFNVIWDKDSHDSCASFSERKIVLGVKCCDDAEIFQNICHELMEVCAMEMHVHYQRPDCRTDFIFVYDHRQHDTMINMFAGLLSQFIK